MNFRACPRCQGDTQKKQDIYGDYIECLQCGYMKDVKKQPPLSRVGIGPEKKDDSRRRAA